MIEAKGLKEEEATLNRRNFTGIGFSYFKAPSDIKTASYNLSDAYFWDTLYTRDRPRFLDKVGHQTANASIEKNIFLLNNDIVKLTKIMNKLVKDCKIRTFSA